MTACRTVIEIREIVSLLSTDIARLCEILLPSGRRDGHEWRVGSIAGEPGTSLGVHLTGAKAGLWKDFASDEGGDALDLVAAVLYHGNKSDAVKWSRDWLGLEGADPEALDAARRRARTEAARKKERLAAEAREKAATAQRLYFASDPNLLGTPVDRYLAGRGIGLARLPKVPGALRFHPGLWHEPTRTKFPTMVAQVLRVEFDETGAPRARPVGIHRTYLAARPNGTVGKAGRDQGVTPGDAKRVLGLVKGGFIPLARGTGGRRLTDPKADVPWAICEGIEDALTIAQVKPEMRVVAGISLSMMTGIVLPDNVREVVLCADNDINPAAQEGLARVIETLRKAGRKVRVARPPVDFKDFNEWWCAKHDQAGAA